jgi:RNA recognition motif-containing protein
VVPREPDALKLFLGMLPKHLDVSDLRPVFEPYGEIHDIAVLKDRLTNQSKGLTCFDM